jgi:uncharacterized protein (TIGR02246 family)
MSSRTTLRVVGPLALLALAGALPGPVGWSGCGPARALAGTPEPQPPRPAAPKPDVAAPSRPVGSEDERAVRAADEAFVAGYNKGDSKALAALFTEDAEVEEAEGDRYQGRDLIERRLAETFAASPGVRITIEADAIRFLSPEVVKEDGRSVVTPTAGAPLARRFTAIFVRRDGRWLISSVREDEEPLVRPHDRLKDLEWLIGEWVDEGADSVVRLDCRWSEDGNYLIRSFTVRRQGKPVLAVSQRIGWDPLARQVRSWEFDSEGGFGEGRWSRDGERWVVKHTGVRPEGTTASATNVMSRERPDLIRWVSTDRVLGDESVPDEQSYVLVRVPPLPRVRPQGGAAAPPTSNTTPNTTRSPR